MFLILIASFLVGGCATGYSPEITRMSPDVSSVRAGVLYDVDVHQSPSLDNVSGTVYPGRQMSVLSMAKRTYSDGSGGTVYEVETGSLKGWVKSEHVTTPSQYREDKKLLESLRSSGKTAIPSRQAVGKNSADGITVSLVVGNISDTKTIKYIRATWKLFNGVGDPVRGENSGESTAEVKLTGPIKPKELSTFTAENVWYSSTGTCAELRGVQVQHIDGSTSTITDLNSVSRPSIADAFKRVEGPSSASIILGNPVKTSGDCSYEAQQSRQ